MVRSLTMLIERAHLVTHGLQKDSRGNSELSKPARSQGSSLNDRRLVAAHQWNEENLIDLGDLVVEFLPESVLC